MVLVVLEVLVLSSPSLLFSVSSSVIWWSGRGPGGGGVVFLPWPRPRCVGLWWKPQSFLRCGMAVTVAAAVEVAGVVEPLPSAHHLLTHARGEG